MDSWGWLSGLVAAIVAVVIGARSMDATDASHYSAEASLTTEALRQGGFVIFIRHATADVGFDAPTFDLADCTTQRNLGEKGRAEAAQIGRSIRDQRIPIGSVLSSEYCRALETARLAFGNDQPAQGLNNCCADGRPLSADDRVTFIVAALATRPHPGTNTVLIGHAGSVVADLAMGEAAVYAPDGAGGSTRVARILPSEWANGVYRPGGGQVESPALRPQP